MSYHACQDRRMNKQLIEIAFVLDRSGSMGSVARSAVDGFNDFLREQQSAPGQARFTLVLFDDEYLVPADAVPIDEVVPLNAGTYVPRGSTALLDAIGRTVDSLGRRLAATPAANRPGKVIVDAAGAKASFKASSRKAAAMRMAAACPAAPRPADLDKPLAEINAEEDHVERGQR